MSETKAIWDWESDVEFDEDGLPILKTENEENETINDVDVNIPQNNVVEHHSQNIRRIDQSAKIQKLPQDVVNIIKNGKKENKKISVEIDVETLPKAIIEFISESYNVDKVDIMKETIKMSIDQNMLASVIWKAVESELDSQKDS